jgi:hypothetical protein
MTGIIRPLDGLEKVLRYEPDTGHLFWLVDRPRKTKAGDRAGHENKQGYIEIRYNFKNFAAHRVAWYLHTEQDPSSAANRPYKWQPIRQQNCKLAPSHAGAKC